MDIGAGEHLKGFQKHLFQELIGAFLAGAEFPVVRRILQPTGQLGIGGPGLKIVPRHLYFRDNLYLSFGGKGQELSDVFLAEITAISPRRTLLHKTSSKHFSPTSFPLPEIGYGPPGSILGKPWVSVYL